MNTTDINNQVENVNVRPLKAWTKKWRKENEQRVSVNIKKKEAGVSSPQRGIVMDGFLLLDACRVELPHEALVAKVQGLGITDVAEEDLKYFSNLMVMDVSDNRIAMEQLMDLVSLNELNLNCNVIGSFTLPDQVFPFLEKLHLAYNRLDAKSIPQLTHLQSLK